MILLEHHHYIMHINHFLAFSMKGEKEGMNSEKYYYAESIAFNSWILPFDNGTVVFALSFSIT